MFDTTFNLFDTTNTMGPKLFNFFSEITIQIGSSHLLT